MADDEHPRPVILTDELKAQLGKVSTATLTQQLQRRGVRYRDRHQPEDGRCHAALRRSPVQS